MNKEGWVFLLGIVMVLCCTIFVTGAPPPPPNIIITPPSTCTITNGGIEACDNVDNDCDNLTDEGLTNSSGCSQVGYCSGSFKTCSFGNWSACSKLPMTEVCNDNIDNNCNNLVDIADPVCQSPEVCDGKDNNGDGYIDEGLTNSSGCSQVGYCSGSFKTCSFGNWSACSKLPRNETCNAIDDDCDNIIDEGLTRAVTCGGLGNCVNSVGTETCVLGNWTGSTCNPYGNATAEVCDGLRDENCNGVVDENCSCRTGENRTCGSSVGECVSGIQSCISGAWGSSCVGSIGPANETCDNKDNDCDNVTDENLTDMSSCTQSGYCYGAIKICSAGVWSGCSVLPKNETCSNSIDDDCDGFIDENCTSRISTTSPSSGSSGSSSRSSQAPQNAASSGSSSGSSSSNTSKNVNASIEKPSNSTVNVSLLEVTPLSDKVNNLSMTKGNQNLFRLFQDFSLWKMIIVIIISLCIVTFLAIFIVDYSRRKAGGEGIIFLHKIFSHPAKSSSGMQQPVDTFRTMINTVNYSQTNVRMPEQIASQELSPQEIQALNYISAMRQRGFNDNYIYGQLINKGWREDVLMNLFRR